MAEKAKREKKEILIPESRDFKGVWIPEKIYLTREFSPNEKFVLLEIYSLTKNKSRKCFASNKHFADFVGLKENSIQKMLSKFEKSGYIKRFYEYKENSQEIEKRIIMLTDKFYEAFVNEHESSNSDGMEKNPCGHGKESTGDMEKNPEPGGKNVGDKYNSFKYNNDLSNTGLSDTHNSLSIDKGSEKNSPPLEGFNSHSTKSRNETEEKPNKNLSESEIEDLVSKMPLRARKICCLMTEDEDLSANVEDCIEYFLDRHKAFTGKRHNLLKDETLQKVVESITEVNKIDWDEFVNTYAPLVTDDLKDKSYKRIIDIYFKTKFRQKIDYSIVHFTNERILTNMMNHDKEIWHICGDVRDLDE